MPFDEEAEDERPDPSAPLPPEDRLWRHPSELGPKGAGPSGRVPSWPDSPWPTVAMLDPAASPAEHRRSSWASVATVSCLAGAVLAMGVVLATRPDTRVVERRATATASRRPITSVVFKPFPTEKIAAQVSPAVARLDVRGPKSWQQPASAVLLDDRGTLVTSAEVVQGSRKLVVRFEDDRALSGRLAGVDPKTGLAIITVDVQGRRGIRFAGTGARVGEPTVMVGGPGSGEGSGTVTTGAIRGLGRQMDASNGVLHDMMQLDRPVVDDTAGGALVNIQGQVLGICLQAKPTDLGYAVPINLVRKVADALRKGRRVRWGRLGVQATNIDPGHAQDLDIPGAARLQSVDKDSPAAKAGLVEGDMVTQLGSSKVQSVTDLVAALSEHRPGDVVIVEFHRGMSSRWVVATLDSN